jgi:solute carrier family 25 carnitine/acylcarnitine transporter 20/29
MAKKGIRRDQVNPMNTVLYGAAAGYAVSLSFTNSRCFAYSSQLWAVIYPIDMIKSRMQTDGFTSSTGQKYTSTLDCVRKVWRAEGLSAFTRGLGPTLIRYVATICARCRNLFHNQVAIRKWRDLPWFRDG